jgi:hypothetical protein
MSSGSKKTCLAIARHIGGDAELFAGLVHAFFAASGKEQDWLMWVIGHIVEDKHYLLTPHLDDFVHLLDAHRSGAINRGILRMLRDAPDIPEAIAGEAYIKSFDLVGDPRQPIAVRAFGIKVLTRIALSLPGLEAELVPLFQDIYAYTEKGLRASARDALRKFGEKT